MNTRTDTPLPATDYENDLQRLGELASLVAAAQDALSDDMVSRLASAFSEGITLLDRLTRNEGLMRLLQVLDRAECQYVLTSLADAITQMSRELATAPPAKGGLGGLLKLAREPGTQEGLRALSMLGKYWNDSLRELHRHGG
jgi:uncharacterized protein YjgD (DUF1641 family)